WRSVREDLRSRASHRKPSKRGFKDILANSSRCLDRDFPAGGAGGRTHKVLTPPGIGIDSDESTKDAAEMSLVAHAALEGHLRQGPPRRQHQFLGSPDAPLLDIGNRRLSKGLGKGAGEMARAELHGAREISCSDTRVQFVLDVGSDAPGLPGRETALHTRAL